MKMRKNGEKKIDGKFVFSYAPCSKFYIRFISWLLFVSPLFNGKPPPPPKMVMMMMINFFFRMSNIPKSIPDSQNFFSLSHSGIFFWYRIDWMWEYFFFFDFNFEFFFSSLFFCVVNDYNESGVLLLVVWLFVCVCVCVRACV